MRARSLIPVVKTFDENRMAGYVGGSEKLRSDEDKYLYFGYPRRQLYLRHPRGTLLIKYTDTNQDGGNRSLKSSAGSDEEENLPEPHDSSEEVLLRADRSPPAAPASAQAGRGREVSKRRNIIQDMKNKWNKDKEEPWDLIKNWMQCYKSCKRSKKCEAKGSKNMACKQGCNEGCKNNMF